MRCSFNTSGAWKGKLFTHAKQKYENGIFVVCNFLYKKKTNLQLEKRNVAQNINSDGCKQKLSCVRRKESITFSPTVEDFNEIGQQALSADF